MFLFWLPTHAGSESGQHPRRANRRVQDLRFWYLEADGRRERAGGAHGDARHGLLDGARGRQYRQAGIQRESRYLERGVRGARNVGG